MLVFDTTGSMSGALDEAKSEISDAMTSINSRLPDVRYAVSEVRDYGGLYGDPGDQPWTLDQAMTSDGSSIQRAIDSLNADGGGDGPEAYGRGLVESDANPSVAWRPGAKRVILLVADNVPHDNDLNEGIPAANQASSSPFDTGVDPGPVGVIAGFSSCSITGIPQGGSA